MTQQLIICFLIILTMTACNNSGNTPITKEVNTLNFSQSEPVTTENWDVYDPAIAEKYTQMKTEADAHRAKIIAEAEAVNSGQKELPLAPHLPTSEEWKQKLKPYDYRIIQQFLYDNGWKFEADPAKRKVYFMTYGQWDDGQYLQTKERYTNQFKQEHNAYDIARNDLIEITSDVDGNLKGDGSELNVSAFKNAVFPYLTQIRFSRASLVDASAFGWMYVPRLKVYELGGNYLQNLNFLVINDYKNFTGISIASSIDEDVAIIRYVKMPKVTNFIIETKSNDLAVFFHPDLPNLKLLTFINKQLNLEKLSFLKEVPLRKQKLLISLDKQKGLIKENLPQRKDIEFSID